VTACNHCWHRAAFACAIHAGPSAEHIDEVCCHCGQTLCRTIIREPESTAGHGPHHPARAAEARATIRMISGESVRYTPSKWVGS